MSNYIKLFNNHSEYTAFMQTPEFIRPNVSHCIQENEVHYNPIEPSNGHAYVDLGLPSGTLWATMNVGANNITDNGLYFAWGETQGYTPEQVTGSATPHKSFNDNDYELTDDSGATMSKYNTTDGKMTLDREDDAVSVNWGGEWHLPYRNQFRELVSAATCYFISGGSVTSYTYNGNISSYWGLSTATTELSVSNTILSGSVGMICIESGSGLVDSITSGQFVFLPSAGDCVDGFGPGEGSSTGEYWINMLSTGPYNDNLFDQRSADNFGFSNTWASTGTNGRSWGLPVRGVIG